jgi:hypothetical protein
VAGRTRIGPTGGATASQSSAKAKSGGDGGGQPDGDGCDLHFTTPLQGPNAAVVATLAPGDELEIEVRPGSPYPSILCKVPATGQVAGSLGAANEVPDLIACSDRGNKYRGQVVGSNNPPLIRVFRAQRPGG